MNKAEYQKMRECEDELWWYRALHLFLRKLIPPPQGVAPTALDVGCGTGGWMNKLATLGYRVTGFDMSEDAVALARGRGLASVFVGDANAFALPDSTYDLVTCIDVFECREVEPENVVREVVRVLKPGGWALFQLPAFEWLSSQHDVAIHGIRRYRLDQLIRQVKVPGLEVVRATYLFALLLPAMAAWKWLHPTRSDLSEEEAESDVRLPPRPINALLYALCWLESLLLPRVRLPFGTSVCVLTRRCPDNAQHE
jgi:SAM-dependent methyltransferase